jgi:hypothetical protein
MSTPHFPGWYPDPDQSGRERLWDGQAWTHHLRKAAGGSSGLSPRAIAVAIGSAVLGLILIVALVASGSDRDATETALPAPASSPSVQPTSVPPTPTPRLARVPAVKGLSLTKAKRKLHAAGLEVGHIDRRPSGKRKGTVAQATCRSGHKIEGRFQRASRRCSAAPSGALGSWQAESFGNQGAQGCWLHGQEDIADEDHW